MADRQLSPHFMLSEFLVSQTAARQGIPNIPSESDILNLEQLAQRVLEPVRSLLGNKPIVISSGYRGHRLNMAVGGAVNSDHKFGRAADFTCPGFGAVRDICTRLNAEEGLPFYQLIREFDQGNSGWVHISWRDDPAPVRQALVIDPAGTRPLTA